MKVERLDKGRYLIDDILFLDSHPLIIQAGDNATDNHTSTLDEIKLLNFADAAPGDGVELVKKKKYFKCSFVKSHSSQNRMNGLGRQGPTWDGLTTNNTDSWD